jgi:peptidoglycan hydrolase-like protein with peptidoglycan-binding domain
MLSVLARQFNLQRIGYMYYTGALDGIEGPLTIAAVKAFQTDQGLAVDGIYGPQTDAALIAETQAVQVLLNNFGYGLAVDGIAGSNTYAAIKAFQTANGLSVDGIAGQQTIAKLKEGQSAPEPVPKGYISKNFKENEFRCECGGKYCDGYGDIPKTANGTSINQTLINVLQRARDYYGKPVYITSGCRCKTINDSLGSSEGSRHRQGKAADCYIGSKVGVTDEMLCAWFDRQPEVRYTYTGFGAVHVDVY